MGTCAVTWDGARRGSDVSASSRGRKSSRWAGGAGAATVRARGRRRAGTGPPAQPIRADPPGHPSVLARHSRASRSTGTEPGHQAGPSRGRWAQPGPSQGGGAQAGPGGPRLGFSGADGRWLGS